MLPRLIRCCSVILLFHYKKQPMLLDARRRFSEPSLLSHTEKEMFGLKEAYTVSLLSIYLQRETGHYASLRPLIPLQIEDDAMVRRWLYILFDMVLSYPFWSTKSPTVLQNMQCKKIQGSSLFLMNPNRLAILASTTCRLSQPCKNLCIQPT